MKKTDFPITDDHIHIDKLNGRGNEAAKDFMRAGGTHLFLVTKPSWSYGLIPKKGSDYKEVYDRTLETASEIRSLGLSVYPVMGVHPAEISRLAERMPLEEAVDVMKDALALASGYVGDGLAVAIKSGRPHYEVVPEVWSASNDILMHALKLSKECNCALQIHAESGPCSDVAEMAKSIGQPLMKVVKHYATEATPLMPSILAKHEAIPGLCRKKVRFTMESDYMDENTRPGAVIGPKSVPRFTLRMLEGGLMDEEDVFRIHRETPEMVYGVEINL